MKTFLNLLLIAGAALAVVLFIGYVQAPEETTRIRAVFRKPVDEVWPTVVDFEHWAQWNPDVKSMASAGDRNFHPAWTVQEKSGRHVMEIAAVEMQKKLDLLVESGSTQTHWTWTFRQVPAGTELTITKLDTRKNIFLRGLRLFQKSKEPIELVLVGLATHLELRVEPQVVEPGDPK